MPTAGRVFFKEVDLFGTRELCGSSLMVLARQAWAELVLEAEAELDLYAPDSLPIAMSRSDIDLFVLDQAGHVRWLAGYQADWYETFDDFFAAMVKSSKATARQLRRLGA